MMQDKPSSASPSDYVRTPVQARSTKTLEKIIAAAMEVFEDQGFKHASMTEIASRAGVSVATLYTRFENKEALLDFFFSNLQSTHLDAARAQFESDGWLGVSIGDRIDHLIGELIRGAGDHTGLLRALSYRQLLEERTPSEIECEEQVSAMLAGWLRDGARDGGCELAEDSARMAVSLITSTVRMQIVFGITCGLSREKLVDQLSTAVHSYIDATCKESAGGREDADE